MKSLLSIGVGFAVFQVLLAFQNVVCWTCASQPLSSTPLDEASMARIRGGEFCYRMGVDPCPENPGGCGSKECIPLYENPEDPEQITGHQCELNSVGSHDYKFNYQNCITIENTEDPSGWDGFKHEKDGQGNDVVYYCWLVKQCGAECDQQSDLKWYCKDSNSTPRPASGEGDNPVESSGSIMKKKVCVDEDEVKCKTPPPNE